MDNIYQRLVDHFHGQTATATKLEVDQSTVSGWVRGLHGMSPAVAVRAEKASSGVFSRRDLCPSFPWEEFAA